MPRGGDGREFDGGDLASLEVECVGLRDGAGGIEDADGAVSCLEGGVPGGVVGVGGELEAEFAGADLLAGGVHRVAVAVEGAGDAHVAPGAVGVGGAGGHGGPGGGGVGVEAVEDGDGGLGQRQGDAPGGAVVGRDPEPLVLGGVGRRVPLGGGVVRVGVVGEDG